MTEKSRKKVLVSLSGGIDSAVVLGLAKSFPYEVMVIGFKYPSKHNYWEMEAAVKIAQHYDVPRFEIDATSVLTTHASSLTNPSVGIPEGHYGSDEMKTTIIPGRNLIFISIMVGFAESVHAQEIWFGSQGGRNSIYPDCRPAFMESLGETIGQGTEGRVSLFNPLISKDKSEVLQTAIRLKVPLNLTRSCYSGNKIACGKCGACSKRLEAFEISGMKDPIEYELSN